jgi:hypothetical protein
MLNSEIIAQLQQIVGKEYISTAKADLICCNWAIISLFNILLNPQLLSAITSITEKCASTSITNVL